MSIEQAKVILLDLIDAAVGGEEVIIAAGELQLVRLVPVRRAESRPQFGSAAGLVAMSENFEKPLEDFEEYTR